MRPSTQPEAPRHPIPAASGARASDPLRLEDAEFARCAALIHRLAGIHLGPHKKALVCSRLEKRLRARGMASYREYFSLLESGNDPSELQTAVDLLTTNETYFFRESRHFEYLRDVILPASTSRPFRSWSAACSSGEEPYSIAMVLADKLGTGCFELLATDLSTRVLRRAETGHYSMARADKIPVEYLRRFCLRGKGPQAGTLLVDPSLRQQVRFRQINLTEPLPSLPMFDVIWLRNVMIYFDDDTRRAVVTRLLQVLNHGGHLFIGHSENLRGVTDKLEPVGPAIYRKP